MLVPVRVSPSEIVICGNQNFTDIVICHIWEKWLQVQINLTVCKSTIIDTANDENSCLPGKNWKTSSAGIENSNRGEKPLHYISCIRLGALFLPKNLNVTLF